MYNPYSYMSIRLIGWCSIVRLVLAMENTKDEFINGKLHANLSVVPEDTNKRTAFNIAEPSVKNCSSTQDNDCSKSLPRGCAAPEKRFRAWQRAELLGLFFLVVIVWVLLSLPIVFYHRPPQVSRLLRRVAAGILVCFFLQPYRAVAAAKMLRDLSLCKD